MTGAKEHYFTILSCVALVAHLVLNFGVLMNRGTAVVLKGFRECRRFMLGLLAFFLTDSFWSAFAKSGMPRLLYVDTVLYFLALSYSAFAWGRYVVVHQEIDGWRRRFLNGSGLMLMAFFIGALAVNFFNGWFFSFDSQGVYTSGPLRDLGFSLLWVFTLLGSVVTLGKALRRGDEKRWYCLNDFAIGIVMTLACFFQMMNPLSPILAIGLLVGSSFLHDFISAEKIEEERKEIDSIREKAKSYEEARLLAEVEQKRAQRERCVAASLEKLLTTKDLSVALDEILARWCEVLGAQWSAVDRQEDERRRIYQSYAVPGEAPLCATGMAPDDAVLRSVASSFSENIRLNGQHWGTVWLYFREPRELSRDEAQFLRELARCIQMALIGDLYRSRIEGERDRAVAAERSKRLFFSSVSHDIRTPLSAIIGFSELLKQGVAGEAERVRYLNALLSSGKMLARLINDILDLSKLEDGRMEIIREPTDIATVIREVETAFGVMRAQKPIDLVVETADVPLLNVDPHRMRQILYNLVSNAFKYTDSGRITVRSAWSDGRLVLSVTDTGRGISPADKARILQPFVQVADRNHRDGTGLGLSICQRLAVFMGGELTIDSELGKGSTFAVRFPGVEVAKQESRTAKAETHDAVESVASPLRPERVLVVDDSAVNVMLMKSVLTKCGVKTVVTAENGQAALEILRNDASFDLILSDLWMPEMDGEGLVKAIRTELKLDRLPVYLVTADVETIHSYTAMGFTGILLKPVSIARIRELFGI